MTAGLILKRAPIGRYLRVKPPPQDDNPQERAE